MLLPLRKCGFVALLPRFDPGHSDAVKKDRHHCRYDSVAKGSNPVHPMGAPMNHSHQVGFNPPPGNTSGNFPWRSGSSLTTTFRFGLWRVSRSRSVLPSASRAFSVGSKEISGGLFRPAWEGPAFFASWAVSVGSRARKPLRVSLPLGQVRLDRSPSPATSVGANNRRAAVRPRLGPLRPRLGPTGVLAALAIRVGKTKPALAQVGRSGVLSRNKAPLRVVPHLGKVSQDGISVCRLTSVPKVNPGIFQEDVARSSLAYGPEGVRPQVAPVSCSRPLSGDGVRLAGEAGSDEVHQAGQWSKIGGSHVPDDGRPVEQAVPDSVLDDLLAVFIYLNVSHRPKVHSGQPQAQLKAAVAGEKTKLPENLHPVPPFPTWRRRLWPSPS